MSFASPRSFKSSSAGRSQFSASGSMRMSELQSPRSAFANDPTVQSIFNPDPNDSEFVAQMASRNAEIESAKYDIQELLTKANAFCKNSGLGGSELTLPQTPPRYPTGTTVAETNLGSSYGASSEFFRSTPPRKPK